MTLVHLHRFHAVPRIAIGAAALLAVSAAWAQVTTQNLTIGFQAAGFIPTVNAVPLSGWLTAGIALLVAASAFVVLRRRRLKGGKLLSALLVVAASATLFGVAGERIIGAATAAPGPVAILDLTSPTIDVAPFAPNSFLQVTVVNNTGQSIQITSINLASGLYVLSTPTTCAVGLVMASAATCSIGLALLS